MQLSKSNFMFNMTEQLHEIYWRSDISFFKLLTIYAYTHKINTLGELYDNFENFIEYIIDKTQNNNNDNNESLKKHYRDWFYGKSTDAQKRKVHAFSRLLRLQFFLTHIENFITEEIPYQRLLTQNDVTSSLYYQCSRCGSITKIDYDECKQIFKNIPIAENPPVFCPHCVTTTDIKEFPYEFFEVNTKEYQQILPCVKYLQRLRNPLYRLFDKIRESLFYAFVKNSYKKEYLKDKSPKNTTNE